MNTFGLAPLAAGYVQGTVLTAGQIAPATLGSKATKGTTGLCNILLEQPVDISQVVIHVGPPGVGAASGIIPALTASQVNGQLQLGLQFFRRDTGAVIDTDFSYKVEQLQKNF